MPKRRPKFQGGAGSGRAKKPAIRYLCSYDSEQRKPATLREYAYLKAHLGAHLGNSESWVHNYDENCDKCKAALTILLASEEEA